MTGRRLAGLLVAGLVLAPHPAGAQEFFLDGLADIRLVHAADAESWLDGGFGKLRWSGGPGYQQNQVDLSSLLFEGRAELTPDLMALVDVRVEDDPDTPVDLIQGYVRWRPVSTSAWRWSVKAGAFFPPVSLENDAIGWTSPWTLTPSAIDSWVGDELRTIGGAATVEWRGGSDLVTLTASLFGWNEPAGVLLAQHGWTLDDRPAGLFGAAQLPDLLAAQRHEDEAYASLFLEIDGRPGWYAGASWENPAIGKIAVLRYDNDADPSAHGSAFAWHTSFWSLGASSDFGDWTVLAQAIDGSTQIAPSPEATSTTDFYAVYLLAGWERGQWRVAGRLDRFGTSSTPNADLSEHGIAGTLAVTWMPVHWLHVVGEDVIVASRRDERVLDLTPADTTDNQVQLAVKVYF